MALPPTVYGEREAEALPPSLPPSLQQILQYGRYRYRKAELFSHYSSRNFHSLFRKKPSQPWRPPLPKAAPRASGRARGELPSEPWRPLPRPGLASNQRLRCGQLAPQASFRPPPAAIASGASHGKPGAARLGEGCALALASLVPVALTPGTHASPTRGFAVCSQALGR